MTAMSLGTCSGSPVKMPEKSVTTKYMNGAFYSFCNKKDSVCPAHKDDCCQLNAKQWEAFVIIFEKVFRRGFWAIG